MRVMESSNIAGESPRWEAGEGSLRPFLSLLFSDASSMTGDTRDLECLAGSGETDLARDCMSSKVVSSPARLDRGDGTLSLSAPQVELTSCPGKVTRPPAASKLS